VDIAEERRAGVAAATGNLRTTPRPKLLEIGSWTDRHDPDRKAGLAPRTHVGGGAGDRVVTGDAVPCPQSSACTRPINVVVGDGDRVEGPQCHFSLPQLGACRSGRPGRTRTTKRSTTGSGELDDRLG
jgi:hypothetical protein